MRKHRVLDTDEGEIMATVDFGERFSPAEATRGQFVPIDSSSLVGYPSGDSGGVARGRYAELSYIVGSEPGALNIALSGGNVILPVSSVNINEPLQIENEPGGSIAVTVLNTVTAANTLVDTTIYESINVAPTSISTVTFSPNVNVVEIYNNELTLKTYVGFNNVAIQTLSAQALPIEPESFYSIERKTTTLYVGNADASETLDIRVIGHYTA